MRPHRSSGGVTLRNVQTPGRRSRKACDAGSENRVIGLLCRDLRWLQVQNMVIDASLSQSIG